MLIPILKFQIQLIQCAALNERQEDWRDAPVVRNSNGQFAKQPSNVEQKIADFGNNMAKFLSSKEYPGKVSPKLTKKALESDAGRNALDLGKSHPKTGETTKEIEELLKAGEVKKAHKTITRQLLELYAVEKIGKSVEKGNSLGNEQDDETAIASMKGLHYLVLTVVLTAVAIGGLIAMAPMIGTVGVGTGVGVTGGSTVGAFLSNLGDNLTFRHRSRSAVRTKSHAQRSSNEILQLKQLDEFQNRVERAISLAKKEKRIDHKIKVFNQALEGNSNE